MPYRYRPNTSTILMNLEHQHINRVGEPPLDAKSRENINKTQCTPVITVKINQIEDLMKT